MLLNLNFLFKFLLTKPLDPGFVMDTLVQCCFLTFYQAQEPAQEPAQVPAQAQVPVQV